MMASSQPHLDLLHGASLDKVANDIACGLDAVTSDGVKKRGDIIDYGIRKTGGSPISMRRR